MRWGAIVPLIGGQVFGTEAVLRSPPEVVSSFDDFAFNEGFFRRHRPEVPFEIFASENPDLTGLPRVELMTTTCPCAGLSMMNTQKSDSPQRDAMNSWMKRVARSVLRDVRPDVFLGENAPQLITPMGQRVRTFFEELAAEHDYGLSIFKTSSTRAGLPQRRQRTFYIFTRECQPGADDLRNAVVRHERPTFTPAEAVFTPGAFPALSGDDPHLMRLEHDPFYVFATRTWGSRWRTAGGSNRGFVSLWDMLWRTGMVEDFISMFPNEGTMDGMPDVDRSDWTRLETYNAVAQIKVAHRALRKAQYGLGVYAKTPSLSRDGAYNAVTGKTVERLVHPTEDRYLTIREMACGLMGLPRDMALPTWMTVNVVCQNVPVQTAAMATRVALDLVGKCGGTRPAYYLNTGLGGY